MSKSEKQGSSARPRRNYPLVRENLRFAHRLIAGTLPIRLAESLKTLSQDFDFSLRRGELQLLNNSWYVTHTGLLRLARRNGSNPEILLQSISRYYKFLPGEQQEAFRSEVAGQAS